MSHLDLRKKIGQFFMISFEEMRPPKEVETLIKERNIGGVLLFAANCPSVKQTQDLIYELKSYATEASLCLAVDHEGGYVHRLPKPVTHFPPMRQLGKLYEKMPSSKLAYEVGKVMGRELKTIGFDINFAPVVDVNTNPINPVIGSRSFGSRPELVSLVASQLIEGMQEMGLAACAKHFPGHGDTDEDSHKVLPRLPHNRKRLDTIELVPFEAVIQQGVALIMTAHVVYQGIDRDLPATFSVKIIRDILRSELGYEGLVVSDSLAMGAIVNEGLLEEAAVKAFNAGCDLLILGKNPKEVPAVLDRFEKAVESEEIPTARLEAAWEKITTFQKRFVQKSGEKSPDLRVVGCREHKEIFNKIKSLV